VISRWLRRRCGSIFSHAAALLGAVGITPVMLSVGGLIAAVVAGLAFARGRMLPAGVFVCIGGGLDGLDGELARVTATASESGGFIDSVCDHLGDFAIYLGLACYAVASGATRQMLLVLATSFGSLFGSLIRARATSLHVDLKDVGSITRFERLLILLIGAVLNRIEPALWLLAILTNVSALQRLFWVLSRSPSTQARRF
jgi:CDP-diacylglycerol--glycerol-3-phosphate 3-phosphatidyltransferase